MSEAVGEHLSTGPQPKGAGLRDIVVVGASAGGIQALGQIVPRLPEDLHAALLVVVHLGQGVESSLAAILDRQTPLTATAAQDGDPIEHGRIYVAPPDRHMLVADGHVRLSRGPRENGHRPAIDPLFRNAARQFGPRVVGIVLSGNLSDGTIGLKAIDDHGGVTVVQDPSDALYAGMPGHAIDEVAPHHVVPAAEIADLVVRLASEPAPFPLLPEPDGSSQQRTLANMSCPECGGPLTELNESRAPFFVCRVGHSFSTEALFAEQAHGLEAALWTALRVLEERHDLALRLAERMESRGSTIGAERFRRTAAETHEHAAAIRTLVVDFDALAEIGPRGAEVTSATEGPKAPSGTDRTARTR